MLFNYFKNGLLFTNISFIQVDEDKHFSEFWLPNLLVRFSSKPANNGRLQVALKAHFCFHEVLTEVDQVWLGELWEDYGKKRKDMQYQTYKKKSNGPIVRIDFFRFGWILGALSS